MLLIDHLKRNVIGLIIFLVITVSIVLEIGVYFLFIGIISSPLLIFLDARRLGWKKCTIYVGVFIVLISIFFVLVVNFIPFYYYPFLLLIYLLIARKKRLELDDEILV